MAWELALGGGELRIQPWFLPLLAWGYLQYKLVGRYRLRLGGGGPGMDTPPERLVTSDLIAVATAVWLHFRVRRDERRLRERFGEPYGQYAARVRRWIPWVF